MNFLYTVVVILKLITVLAILNITLASTNDNFKQIPTQLRLVEDLLEMYDKKSKPTWNNDDPINVTFSMDLYQILELNEPQQYILLNAWIIESWYDEFLYWEPTKYGNISEIRLPHENIWLPDTTLYNSLVMKDDDTRRLLNAKLTTIPEKKAVHIQLLYPTIYKFSCLLNLKYFPFDTQVCTMVFSSWTYDKEGIDYYPKNDNIGISNYLENEGWYLIKATAKRIEKKYKCCPNKYAILHLTFYLRRKPLFYLVNLIIPTSIITLIALVGFFTTSSASGEREEKVSLGITTLLSMSILMLMVSDQMPTTSTFIPLIGWFILGMIIIISMGTLASSVIITVQKKGQLGERLPKNIVNILTILAKLSFTYIPLHLKEGTQEYEEAPPLSLAYRTSAKLQRDLSSLNKLFDDNSLFNKSQCSDTKIGSVEKLNLDKISDERIIDKLNKNFDNHLTTFEEISKSTTMPMINRRISQQCFNTIYVPYAESEITTERSTTDSVSTPKLNRDKRENFSTYDAENLEIFNKNLKISRRLAIKEYEWFATVLERLCFITFVSCFFILTIGLNAVGYYFWNKEYHDILNSGITINATLSKFSNNIDKDGRIAVKEYQNLPHIKLTKDLLDSKRYDTRVRPVSNHSNPLKIYLSMTLYQIIDVNEPAQNIKLNMWMVQRWHDEMLDWNPQDYNNIESIILPSMSIWKPDTYIYNSVVMNKDDTERHMNVKLDSTRKEGLRGSNISFLYPAIYTTTCRLNVRFFPYEQENCTLIISSWTNDKSALDYYADPAVNLENFIRNEEWDVISFKIFRHEYKYACCEEPWVIIQASLIMRRKPLYYLVNLIIPTSIITLVAITGFFTPGSSSNDRKEKINLGITTLLAMSILMLMVCDQMPTTSEFVPLIAWFYLSIIFIISIGTFLTSIVLAIHSQRQYGKLPSDWARYFFFVIVYKFTLLTVPPQLKQIWIESDSEPKNIYKNNLNSSLSQKNLIYSKNNNSLKKYEYIRNNNTSMIPNSSLLNESQDIEMKTLNNINNNKNNSLKQSNNNIKKKSKIFKIGKDYTNDMNNINLDTFFKRICRGSSRQVALEWEFIASILDRILLITFGSCVIIVTFGMMTIGILAQHYYDLEANYTE